jgi:hypothetical protein
MKSLRVFSFLFAAVTLAGVHVCAGLPPAPIPTTTQSEGPSAPVTQTSSQTTVSNPGSPLDVITLNTPNLSLDQALQTPGNHAGVPKSAFHSGFAPNSGNSAEQMGTGQAPSSVAPGESWFSNPYVFGAYGYSSNKDERGGGYDCDIQSGSFGFGFSSAFDLLVGGAMMYSDVSGNGVGGSETSSKVYSGSVYVSRPFTPWLYWGVAFGYMHADSTSRSSTVASTDSSSDAWSVSPYLTAFKRYGSWTLSASPVYMLGLQDFDYGTSRDDSASMGKFVLMGRATYDFNDKFSASILVNPTVVVHDHEVDGVASLEGRTWLNTGLKFNYRFAQGFDLSAGYTYDAFNALFTNHNFTLALTYSF